MPTINEINQQVAALPHRYVFWTKKEIRNLPKVLDADESVLALTSGMMEARTWLAVCTHRRLIFLNCGMVFGLRQVQLPLERIQSIDHEFGIAFGSIRVWDGASYFTLKLVLKHSIEPFVKTVQAMMAETRHRKQRETSGTPTDLASQLERLADLKDRGVLTEAEFAAQKAKLLSQ